MALWPQRPSQFDLRTRRNLDMPCSWRASNYPTLRVTAALQVGDGDVLNRTVALNGTRDSGDWGTHVRILVGLVEGLVFVSEDAPRDIAVSRDGSGGSESGE
jgi:hypothetical protein